MARNVFFLWLLHAESQAAALNCGSSDSWSCKGICLSGTPGTALQLCEVRGISVCPSAHPCTAVGLCNGWFNLLEFAIMSHVKPWSPWLAASSMLALWGLAWLLHVEVVGGRVSICPGSISPSWERPSTSQMPQGSVVSVCSLTLQGPLCGFLGLL